MRFSQKAAQEDLSIARHWRRWPSGLFNRQRVLDAGLIAWGIIGLLILGWVTAQVIGRLSLVIIPLVIALFPAALLAPAVGFLRRRGARPALAASLVLVAFLVAVVGVLVLVGWLIAEELSGIVSAVEDGYANLQDWFDEQLDVNLPPINTLLDQLQEWALGAEGQVENGAVTGAATTTLEFVAAFFLGLVALFFYLKDGGQITAWFIRLFPPRLRGDVGEVSGRVWETLGAYFRGQLLVAAVDAFFIGLGLVLLDVPLALPLTVLVLIGGMFPVVGAFTAAALAVLIALADQGVVVALTILSINIAVQQAEGNVLAPIIVGRATHLHPLAVLVALTAGGLTFGILGAFLAVPVVASLKSGLTYLVAKDMTRPPDEIPPGLRQHPENSPRDAGSGASPEHPEDDGRLAPTASAEEPAPAADGSPV